MANQQGFSAKEGIGELDRILNHFDRSKMYDEEGNLKYAYYPNLTQRGFAKSYTVSQIDPERTHLNYNLAPAREGGQKAFVECRLAEIYVHKSALANAVVDWVVTLPDMGQYVGREREFFEHAYDYCAKKYGEENIVSAYVHMDEVSPHMHFAFIPIVPDKKHEQGWKLSKKEVNMCERIDAKTGRKVRDTREFSGQFHAGLNAYIEKAMGLEHAGIVLTDEQREKRRIKENMRGPAELRRASAELDRLEEEQRAASEKLAATVAEEAAAGDRLERLRREEERVAGEVADLEKAEMEPVGEGIFESAGALVANRGDGARERELEAENASLRVGIGKLERDCGNARIRISELRAGIARLRGRIAELGVAIKERMERIARRGDPFAAAIEASKILEREREQEGRRRRGRGVGR